MRTEFGTVVVQEDVCNGCGYCVPACPFGVIERRDGPAERATSDRPEVHPLLRPAPRWDDAGVRPGLPDQSIQYGDLDELRVRAQPGVDALMPHGVTDARLYLADPNDGIGGAGAFFLLLDEPEVYGLPRIPWSPPAISRRCGAPPPSPVRR